tara:strand:- start:2757 stop:3035 length:279 start_codon:yes stop_codon:yes gene_type:complete
MGRIITVPYNGSLNTETNPEMLSPGECTRAINLDLFKPGILQKRTGRAIAGFFNGVNISKLIRFKDPDPEQDRHIWIGYDTTNNKLFKITDI